MTNGLEFEGVHRGVEGDIVQSTRKPTRIVNTGKNIVAQTVGPTVVYRDKLGRRMARARALHGRVMRKVVAAQKDKADAYETVRNGKTKRGRAAGRLMEAERAHSRARQ